MRASLLVIGRSRRASLVLTVALVAGCSSSAGREPTAQDEAPPSTTTTTTQPRRTGSDRAVAPCPDEPQHPMAGDQEVAACRLEAEGTAVDVAVYPLPDHEGDPWSAWGQGLVLDDGRHLSAVGDHRGVDGRSYLYEYDPVTATLTLVADIAAEIDGQRDGYGKVHGQLVPAADGTVLLSTYWGDQDDVDPATYGGDHLLRYDPDARTLEDLGALVPGYGVPSLTGSPDGRLLFGEAVDPASSEDRGPFFVYDVERQETVFTGGAGAHVGFRSVLVDAEGRASFSAGDGRLAVYDPATGEVTTSRAELPGAWLRAATVPAADGTVFGATREPDRLFALRADGEVEPLGGDIGYTASLALSPDGRFVYYVPGAHGQGWKQGTPLLALDTATGRSEEIVRLNDLVEPAFGVRVGGTYSVAVDPTGDRVYVTLNGGAPDGESTFGDVVLAVVHVGA